MMFLYCEWFDYDFEVTIFDRDYAEYKDKLEVWKVVIVEWNLDVNFEYGRKNIRSRKIIIASLTQVRDQAKDMGLLDDVKRKMLWAQELQQEKENSPDTNRNTVLIDNQEAWIEWDSGIDEENLEKKIAENKAEKSEKNPNRQVEKYVVDIPSGTQLEQIHRLKDFLSSQSPWATNIFILLSGKEIDTKFALADLQDLHIWETQNL